MTRSGSVMRSRMRAEMYSGMPLQHEAQRLEHFLHRLMEFRLGWVLGLHQGHDIGDVVGRRFDRRSHYWHMRRSSLRNLFAYKGWADEAHRQCGVGPPVFQSCAGRFAVTAITPERDWLAKSVC